MFATRLIDYLAVTKKDSNTTDDIRKALAERFGLDWVERSGRKCYRKGWSSMNGTINVYEDGIHDDQGIHLEFTGDGCRHVETSTAFDWQAFVGELLGAGWNCTRIDVAIDERSGSVRMPQVLAAVEGGHVACRSLRQDAYGDLTGWGYQVSHKAKGGGATVYVGSRQGDTMLRCYEKGKQLCEKIPWLRFELEVKHGKAAKAAQLFVTDGWDSLTGLFRAFLDFKCLEDLDKNRTRQKSAAWWTELVGTAKTVIHGPAKVIADLQATMQHVIHQWAPNLNAIAQAHNGSYDWLVHACQSSGHRLKDKHRRYCVLGSNKALVYAS